MFSALLRSKGVDPMLSDFVHEIKGFKLTLHIGRDRITPLISKAPTVLGHPDGAFGHLLIYSYDSMAQENICIYMASNKSVDQ